MKTQNEIIAKIDEDVTAVEIIRNHENPDECCVIINDELFSTPYETEYSFDLIVAIKTQIAKVNPEIIVIMFNDIELPTAWKQSYLQGGITEDRFDRRTEFHPYNEMNEMFCIDRILLMQITGQDDRMAKWKEGIIKWYKNHLI